MESIHSECRIHDGCKSRKIFVNSTGHGCPPVIFISGYPDRGDYSWESGTPNVYDSVSKFTQAIDYDRPGTVKIDGENLITSRSSPVKQPVTAEDQVKDLKSIVKKLKINTPFIIVAHSAGGLCARLYAYKYPLDVCGMILLDVTNEKLLCTWTQKEIDIFYYSTKAVSANLMSEYKCVEVIDFKESFKQLNDYKCKKLSMTAVIVTQSDIPDAAQLVADKVWPEGTTQETANSIHKAISKASDILAYTFVPKARRITVSGGHYIQKEHPEFVINLIYNMVQKLKYKCHC
jgi:hypothetical protein